MAPEIREQVFFTADWENAVSLAIQLVLFYSKSDSRTNVVV